MRSARALILGNEALTALPIRQVLQAIHDYLPDGDYEELTPEQQSIIDAAVHLNSHRLPQAILILDELIRAGSTSGQWIKNLIAAIETAGALPGTGVRDHLQARDRERAESIAFAAKGRRV